MVEYQKPEFYVEEFVANEYVAACDKEVGEKVELSCKCGVEISSTVEPTSETNARINLADGSVIYLDAVSGSDQIMVFRTGLGSAGCYTSEYSPGYTSGTNPDHCQVFNEQGNIEQTYHHHATVSSVTNFS